VDEGLRTDAPLSLSRALRLRLDQHPLYDALRGIPDLRVFMEHHVYAVWDFMSLVKSLQAQIAPSLVPWVPPHHPGLVRLINQLVLEEESDLTFTDPTPHTYASHFESYCLAMVEIGADILPVTEFIRALRRGGLDAAVGLAGVPEPARRFLRFTFKTIRRGRPYELAAVLAYGRESLIPQMFQSILAGLRIGPEVAPVFHRYLHRHVELDGDEHGPLAVRLVDALCGRDDAKREQAAAAATQALRARLDFWDGIYRAVEVAQDARLAQASG
jgi:hypothetical protein